VRFYLASRYSRGPELRGYRDELRALGHEVTSRWLDGYDCTPGLSPEDHTKERARFAQDDLDDLSLADVVVCFTESRQENPGRGGRHVEYGVALAWDKTIVVIGPRENVFHCLSHVTHYETWEAYQQEMFT